jgi:hypothetical protein
MKVIRHDSGWDIALDMVFIDRTTAEIIAKRIQHAVHALVRDAVYESMCGRNTARDGNGRTLSATASSTTG